VFGAGHLMHILLTKSFAATDMKGAETKITSNLLGSDQRAQDMLTILRAMTSSALFRPAASDILAVRAAIQSLKYHSLPDDSSFVLLTVV
jgi:hypothetical protein